jgi:hypothetical protein
MLRGWMMPQPPLRPGQILTGVLFNEPMRVETTRDTGPDTWVVGLVGTSTERFRNVTLSSSDLEALTILDTTATYDGDGTLLRLGLQAYALGIAYEFDPYFGLSISRVDPLPHQLEAVYDYLLKLPRVRFLLADDAVFNVVGELLPAAHVDGVLRDYYAGRLEMPVWRNACCGMLIRSTFGPSARMPLKGYPPRRST